MVQAQPTKKAGKIPASPTTFHYHSYIKDTVAVQKRHNYVNDSEVHEKEPHLQDYLVPHHIGDVKADDEEESLQSKRPTLPRPCVSILHNKDCPSRHSCEITEAKRHISFLQVTVREYDMILGDHPNCSYGPPVSLGWHFLEYEPLDVNEYEYHHSRRRPLRNLCLTYYRRKGMLLRDYSPGELKIATRQKDRIMTQRSITNYFRWADKVVELIDLACRKAKKTVNKSKRRPKKDVAATWQAEDELDWPRSKFTREKSILETQ